MSELTTPYRSLEFHLSRPARERYQFDRDLLDPASVLPRPDVRAVHELVHRMNSRLGPQGRGAKPGHLYALVLIQAILHRVIEHYRQQQEPELFERAEAWLKGRLSPELVDGTLQQIGGYYTPLPVYHGRVPLPLFLDHPVSGRQGRDDLLEQMLLVYLANINPAAADTRDLYDDRDLPRREEYLEHIRGLQVFLASLPPVGSKRQTLFELLAAPAKASPASLLGQLEYIRTQWAGLLGDDLLRLLLTAQDLVREDEKGPFRAGPPAQGPDPEYLRALASRALFTGTPEVEAFSADKDWMPRVVLLAKSIYVWLDQLSRRYGRSIRRLNEIPDEELDRLASWGFSGLWLIGVWERSPASRMIKHMRGNPDAVASAYSIYDYRISGDLGGDSALDDLRGRALARGIRLASDLVPNHMGIDSRWVREQPDWFVQMDYPPYDTYRFTGPDLASQPGLSLRIEDGYWNQTDAAVVFQHNDHSDGRTRYIYHGNDGTSMPWNDTAQLNFLRPDVREAMIRLIIEVARRFPILRFDAAMTLTKKHYQRLWFPEPGTGGAIPSRALFSLTREEFDAQMPEEFWRQVVDRVAAEAPDTLLLAEAFWLLEGFFVRTLGMHRVYNSAFMNMLKLEENAKYRQVIRNILEFEPRILQRFVNFMNNPDEETAVAQFGKGDKYFGVCMLMATMPGLPMFGHGQIEGLTERYGHEYQRAYYDEHPDDELVRRHEREIFPLLQLRHLFSGADHFLLYDVQRDDASIDENVFAYSNGYGSDRALVVFHNRYAETSGWIRTSVPVSVADGHGRRLVQRSLANGLGLRPNAGLFYVLRDRVTGLEYLRRGADLTAQGIHVQLRAYQYQVFTEFREVLDDAEGRWARLEELLGGRGVPSLEREFKRVYLAPLVSALGGFGSAEHLRELMESGKVEPETVREWAARFAARARPVLEQVHHFGGGTRNLDDAVDLLRCRAIAVLALANPARAIAFGRAHSHRDTRDRLLRILPERCSLKEPFWRVLAAWLVAGTAGLLEERQAGSAAARRLDEWLWSETIEATLRELGAGGAEAWLELEQLRVLLAQHDVYRTFTDRRRFAAVAEMLNDPAVQRIIGAHSHAGIVWFHRESWEQLSRWLFIMAVVDLLADPTLTKAERGERIVAVLDQFRQIDDLSAIADYQLERFRTLLGYVGAPALPTPAGTAIVSEETKT